MKRLIPIVLCLVSLCAQGQADLRKLDAYYSKALQDWGVPGFSVAIVKDGKVVFAKGYGTTEAGKNQRPDENTIYAIASNSKAFTSFLIGQLVDEKKLHWDDNVADHLPYFWLSDPWVTHEANIRDILSHRIGLGTFSGDLIWYRSRLSGEEIIRRVQHLEPAYSFRNGYGYSNVMFITAGEIIRKVTGSSWSDLVRARIFSPTGMSRSFTSTRNLAGAGNVASPHALRGGTHTPIPLEDWEHVAATGGIFSSVRDMSQWMLLNLSHGIWQGDTLLSQNSRNVIWTPHNSFAVDHLNKRATGHFNSYGLGWFISDYRGKLRVGHTGGYTGMTSGVALLPDENLGVVVLTNGMVPVYSALINYTLDAYLRAPVRDWSAEILERYREHVGKDTRIEQRVAARVLNTRPTVPAEKLSGDYRAPGYGTITVSGKDGDLRLSFEHSPDLSAKLRHWHYDTYELRWENPEVLPWFSFGTIKFTTDNNGAVTGIEFDVPNDDFFFEELNASKL